jgi:GAF domain-containing protein
VSDDQLTASLDQLASVVLAERTVEDLLGTVVDLARSTVRQIDGASVTLSREGRLTTSHATDEVVRELDGVQYRDGDGPCVEAVRAGRVVAMEVASDRARFPSFADAADQRFIVGVLATPLAVGERILGGLNCYSATDGRFGPDQIDMAAQFARQASIVLANALALSDATATNEQLKQALESRDLIGQAKGMLMERHRFTAEEAFDVLRRTSQAENKKLTVVARDLVERRSADAG